MEGIDLTLDSLFLRDVDSRFLPEDEFFHWQDTIKSGNVLGISYSHRLEELMFSIAPSQQNSVFGDNRGIDWFEERAIVLGEYPPGVYVEWFSDTECDRCGGSFNNPDDLGRTGLCTRCDDAMNEEFDQERIQFGGVLGI